MNDKEYQVMLALYNDYHKAYQCVSSIIKKKFIAYHYERLDTISLLRDEYQSTHLWTIRSERLTRRPSTPLLSDIGTHS